MRFWCQRPQGACLELTLNCVFQEYRYQTISPCGESIHLQQPPPKTRQEPVTGCHTPFMHVCCVCRYSFATPSTLKPTQWHYPSGSINQIPGTATICGDMRITPFYDMEEVGLLGSTTIH
jgi:hypothetical protein